MAKSLSIVVMGTGPFAVPLFRALYDSPHRILLLVTQPPRPTKGNKPGPINPMRQLAEERGTPVFTPESVNTAESRETLAALQADLFVVADYGQILKPETLAIAPLGGINLHGSLLPQYRGAAPINWALYNGDTTTGVTVIHMTPRIDAGPCLAQKSLLILPDETAPELEQRLSELGGPIVRETIDRLTAGAIRPLEQDASKACPARRLRKTDGEVDWSRSAEQIRNQIRALEPWPRTSSTLHRRHGAPLRLILGPGRVQPTSNSAPRGTVVAVTSEHIEVQTGDGVLCLAHLQPSGKRMMSAAEFARGYPIHDGDTLGPEITETIS